jgi:AcrR family transcriptional regulator
MSTKPALGRPRDADIDAAILVATGELLAEVGYAELTMTAVAARAGTTKPALYRRWPGKAHLVHEAVFPAQDDELWPEGADLRTSLRVMLSGAVELFSRPLVRAALPGLLSEFASHPTLHEALLRRFQADVWERMRARLAESDEVRPDVDADVLVDLVAGAAFMAVTLRATQTDDAWLDACVDLLMRGISR